MLMNLKPGEHIFLESPAGDLQRFMQQIAADVSRCGLNGKVSQALVLGVVPSTRTIIDLVMITRLEDQ